MFKKQCPSCNKIFYSIPQHKNQIFCSRKCSASKRKLQIIKNCLQCKEEFITIPSREKTHKFCSKKCYNIARKEYIFSEKHRKKISKALSGRKVPWLKGKKLSKKNREKLCGRIGNKNSNWKGGKVKFSNGRLYIFVPEHPHNIGGGYVAEYRLIAEEKLNRYLTKKEVIHHIDNDCTNNNPENLYLFSCNSEHSKYHGKNYSLKSNLFREQPI
jgi:endogenous inhibitor of DNA gyrase (YacG/DUF329 family)